MNKAELIDAVSDAANLNKAESGRAVNAVIDAIEQALAQGDSVALIGFGIFAVKARAERQGRNPQTGEAITIEAAKIPSFKPGKTLRTCVNGVS